jgi:hypothetical protein
MAVLDLISDFSALNQDLSDAQACIEWAVAQFPAFQDRIRAWLRDNVHMVRVEQPAPCPNDVVVVREKCALPLAFNVEAGVYIHTLRSSLDILAWVIGKREMVLNPEEIYFPFANSLADFRDGNYRGVKFVRQLSGTSRQLIEATKPYKGGNDLLWTLHYLDVVRKHKRLLTAVVRPANIRVQGDDLSRFFPIRTDTGYFRVDGNRETVIGIVAKEGKPLHMHCASCVAVDEVSLFQGSEIISLLTYFASQAQAVVKLFA